jgi:hypothetical protein
LPEGQGENLNSDEDTDELKRGQGLAAFPSPDAERKEKNGESYSTRNWEIFS